MYFYFLQFLQRIPVSDSEELKKHAEKAWATVKSYLLMAQEQLNSLGIDSAEDYYGLPFVWLQKVNVKKKRNINHFSI